MFFKVLKSDKRVIVHNHIPRENLSELDAKKVISNRLDFNTVKINCNSGFLEYIAIPAYKDCIFMKLIQKLYLVISFTKCLNVWTY